MSWSDTLNLQARQSYYSALRENSILLLIFMTSIIISPVLSQKAWRSIFHTLSWAKPIFRQPRIDRFIPNLMSFHCLMTCDLSSSVCRWQSSTSAGWRLPLARDRTSWLRSEGKVNNTSKPQIGNVTLYVAEKQYQIEGIHPSSSLHRKL